MKKILMTAVFLLAFLLRTVNLSNYPVGFTPDEASFGYDAYSLLKTGKDQWGHPFPLVLESFGDFKPPLYSYILMPFVSSFGLNERSVRLPNALMGSFAVIVTYYLVREFGLVKKKKNKSFEIDGTALFAAFLLAVSPWHIMMSRGAFEANLTTLLLPLGIYYFLRGLHGRKYFYNSAVIFGLNLFSYHSARLVTPLIVFFLIIIFWSELFPKRKVNYKMFIGPFATFMFFVGLTVYSFTQGAGSRVADISILGGSMQAAAGPRLDAINSGTKPFIAKVVHNKFTVTSTRFVSNYRQYFSRKYYFTEGPAEATYGMMPGKGVLYPIEVLLLLGFASFVWKIFPEKKKLMKFKFSYEQRVTIFVISWILIAPVPASLATGPGYAGNRSVIMLPALQTMLAWGGTQYYRWISRSKQKRLAPIFISGYIVVSLVFLGRFIFDYAFLSPSNFASEMLYGRREMVEYLNSNGYTPLKSEIVIDKRLSEPQIYFAFYSKIDPLLYQAWTKEWGVYRDKDIDFVDQLDEYMMGKYLFTTNFVEKEERFGDRYLLVGKPEEFLPGVRQKHIIKNPDGSDAIYIVDPKAKEYASIFQ